MERQIMSVSEIFEIPKYYYFESGNDFSGSKDDFSYKIHNGDTDPAYSRAPSSGACSAHRGRSHSGHRCGYSGRCIYPVPLRRWSISCVPVRDAYSYGGSGTSSLRSQHSTSFLRTDLPSAFFAVCACACEVPALSQRSAA